MKSIVQKDWDVCFECGTTQNLEEHHLMGASNRTFSEKYGLKVRLCHRCHNEPPNGVHFNQDKMDEYHRMAQRAFEKDHSHEEWMRLFMRNYL